MSERLAALVTLLVWILAVWGISLVDPYVARPYLDEGGPVEGLSAILAGAAASAALIALARHARRHGGKPTPTAVREAVVMGLLGVLLAGEELSWGEGLVWEATTTDRTRRLDAFHDVLNLLAAKGAAEPIAIVIVVVGVSIVALGSRAAAAPWRRAAFALGLLSIAAAVDTLHLEGIPLLATEELGELLCDVWLLAAALAVGRPATHAGPPSASSLKG